MGVVWQSIDDYEILGTTVDDSVGEAFDKVARTLRLGFHQNAETHKYSAQAVEEARQSDHDPITGHYGAVLEALAREGQEGAVKLPIPLIQKPVSLLPVAAERSYMSAHCDAVCSAKHEVFVLWAEDVCAVSVTSSASVLRAAPNCLHRSNNTLCQVDVLDRKVAADFAASFQVGACRVRDAAHLQHD